MSYVTPAPQSNTLAAVGTYALLKNKTGADMMTPGATVTSNGTNLAYAEAGSGPAVTTYVASGSTWRIMGEATDGAETVFVRIS